MALQLRVSNHRWQPHEEQSFDRKIGDLFLLIRPPGELGAVAKAELDQGGASRHDARPAGPPFLDASNRDGVRLKWCGDELDPTVFLPT